MGSGFIPEDQVVSSSDASKEKLYEMGPGATIGLAENEDIEIADPKRPNGAFEPFFMAIVKEIGAAVELPQEQVLQCFNSSYSASRAAMLEAWKAFKTHRRRLVAGLCQPVYEAWLSEAVAAGRVDAPGFFDDPLIRSAWVNSKWNGPGQGLINPEAEIKASVAAIDNCLSTHEEEYAARTGEDWEPMARTLSRERALKEELGLKSSAEIKAESFGSTGDTANVA
jgi:capsid protein